MSAKYEHFQLLRRPVVSEKAYNATGANNQYTFLVAAEADKIGIKRAVEAVFGVKVDRVQVMNVQGKIKRRGLRVGRRTGYRKAVVRLAEGHSLEAMEEA